MTRIRSDSGGSRRRRSCGGVGVRDEQEDGARRNAMDLTGVARRETAFENQNATVQPPSTSKMAATM